MKVQCVPFVGFLLNTVVKLSSVAYQNLRKGTEFCACSVAFIGCMTTEKQYTECKRSNVFTILVIMEETPTVVGLVGG
jgi:hypothetical protein